MGSATPSVEAWFLMSQKRLKAHFLSKRLAGGAMPQIKTIDLSRTKNSGCISDELADEIRKLKELADDGIITQEEFEAKKKQLLGL